MIQQMVQSGNGPPPTASNTINNLPEYQYKSNKDDNKENESDCKNKECAICKEPFVSGDLLKELPCKHRYHKDCIMPWLTKRNTCPVCRYRLPTDNAFYEQMQNARNNNNGNNGPPPFNLFFNQMFGPQQQ